MLPNYPIFIVRISHRENSLLNKYQKPINNCIDFTLNTLNCEKIDLKQLKKRLVEL